MKTEHKYIVKVLVVFGDDECHVCDYTGEEYNNFEDAQEEMKDADKNPTVSRSWIEHTWIENKELWGEEIYR